MSFTPWMPPPVARHGRRHPATAPLFAARWLAVAALLLAAACSGAGAAQEQDPSEAGAAAFCARLDALEDHDAQHEVKIGSRDHLDRLERAVETAPDDVRRAMQVLVDYLASLDLEGVPVEDVPAAADYPAEVGEAIVAVQDHRAEVCPDWPPEPDDHEH